MPSTRYSFGMPMVRPFTPRETAASKSGTGRSAQVVSRASAPAIEPSRIAQSRTVRAIGPAWSRDEAKATVPQRETAPVGRLDPDRAGEGGRLADGAAGIGGGGAEAEPRGHRRGGAARRAAGHERRVGSPAPPGRDHVAVGAGLVRRAHGELVEIELAEHDGAVAPQIGRDRRLVVRLEGLQDLGSRRGGHAVGAEQVLDPERDALRAAAPRRRRSSGRTTSAISRARSGRLQQVGVQGARLRHRVEMRLRQLAGREAASPSGRRAPRPG